MNLFRPKTAPAPEPFDPSAWIGRTCDRLRRECYARPLPGGGTCSLGLLMRLYRYVRREFEG